MKKALLSKVTARSDVVKGCIDRLKNIEVRLDVGVDPGWLKELDAVQDMVGVAAQLLPLQKIASLDDAEPAKWLQGATADGADVDSVELSKRVLQALDEVDRAVPPARDPTDMLGEVVLKHFEGHGTFMGTIVEYDQHTGFRLQYDDGDTEDVSLGRAPGGSIKLDVSAVEKV